MTQAEVYERSLSMVRLAKSFQDDVEYSAMDTTRTEPDYLAQVLNGCIEAGATTINLADTVGYATPDEWRQLIEWLYAQVPAMADVTVSVHCHNDLGLATANSLIGIRAGAARSRAASTGSASAPATPPRGGGDGGPAPPEVFGWPPASTTPSSSAPPGWSPS